MARVLLNKSTMKIAVSYCQDRISPVFDVSENLLLINVLDGLEEGRENVELIAKAPFERAGELSRRSVDVLLCGAISAPLEGAVRNAGIEVLGFVCGELDDVVKAFIRGGLTEGSFAMPGCCGRRRGNRNGHCGTGRQK